MDQVVQLRIGELGIPGVAYGVVIGGEFVHRHGRTPRHRTQATGEKDSIFCIASMTKSFSAPTILLLRDIVFVLANRTYASAGGIASDLLKILLDRGVLLPRKPVVSPELR